MDSSDRQKRLKAGRNPLPADHQPAVFLLKPGKGALGLEPWHPFFDRSAPVFLRLPDPLGYLGANPSLPELLPEGFGIIPFILRDDLEAFAWTAPFPGADLDRLKQRQHVRPLVSVGRRGPVRQGHAAAIREAVDQDPLALSPMGDALAAPLPRNFPTRVTARPAFPPALDAVRSLTLWRGGAGVSPPVAGTAVRSHPCLGRRTP